MDRATTVSARGADQSRMEARPRRDPNPFQMQEGPA